MVRYVLTQQKMVSLYSTFVTCSQLYFIRRNCRLLEWQLCNEAFFSVVEFTFTLTMFLLVPKYSPQLFDSRINSTEAVITWKTLSTPIWSGIPLRYELTVVENLRNGTVLTSLFMLAPNRTTFLADSLIPYTNCSVFITACTSIGCCQPNKTDFVTLESGTILYNLMAPL